MNKSVASIRNKKQMVEPRVGPKHDEETYFKLYQREKKERKRYQNMVGEIDARIDKVNDENQQIFTDMQIAIDYWKFSFHLAAKSGVDFLNYEMDLLKKGLIKKEEEEEEP